MLFDMAKKKVCPVELVVYRDGEFPGHRGQPYSTRLGWLRLSLIVAQIIQIETINSVWLYLLCNSEKLCYHSLKVDPKGSALLEASHPTHS